jgi:hypothetical protein
LDSNEGQVVILWATGLGSMSINQSTGLRQQNNPTPLTLGVSQSNPARGANTFNFNWRTQTPIWAGESPQYVGLDQVNVQFPICNGPAATAEQRFNAALTFTAHDNSGYPANAIAMLYMPFLISSGEPTCSFGAPTTISLVSGANSASGVEAIEFSVTVSPSSATGLVTLSDDQGTLMISTLVAGKVSLPVYSSPSGGLTTGTHTITATYNGSATYQGSSATVNQSVQNPALAPTTTTLTSSVSPSSIGQEMTFTATVSPCCLPTGGVTFYLGDQTLNCAGYYLTQGKVICSTFGLWVSGSPQVPFAAGTYTIKAVYSGDSSYASSSSNLVTQVINPVTGLISLNTWSYRGGTGASEAALGEQVSLSVTVGYPGFSPGSSVVPTGTVTIYDGTAVLATLQLSSAGALLITSTLPVGTHVLKATYSGDTNVGAASSSTLTVTIWNPSSFTSTFNPSSVGQTVTFTLCGVPSNVTKGYVAFIIDGLASPVSISSPCTSDSVNWLIKGSHSVKVGLDDIPDRTVTTVSFPFSIIQVVN